MIRSFGSKALADFWTGKSARRIAAAMHTRLRRRLDALDAAVRPEDMNVPGFDFHRLHGQPVRYSVHVNGPWCVTFSWDGRDAIDVDFEQYH